MIQAYAKTTARAKKTGYDGIEGPHGGHGYLLAQFMCPYYNRRTDYYGGHFEKRMMFPLEVIQACRQAVGDDFPIIYRIAIDEFIPGGRTVEESEEDSPDA